MTELEFRSLALQGFNRIPLIAEAFADLETPLSLYLKLARADGGGASSFLLESVVGGERFGRYSFIGLPARTLLRASGFRTEVVTDGTVVETRDERSGAQRCASAVAKARRSHSFHPSTIRPSSTRAMVIPVTRNGRPVAGTPR